MKNLLFIFLTGLFLTSCNQSNTSEQKLNTTNNYEYFGAEINDNNAIKATHFFDKFNEQDSIHMKVEGTITSVCKKKGCWMKMNIGDSEEELFVRFKDYDFFVPLNCENRTAVIEGWAYKEALSIDELKHYAFDAGKSEEEINDINAPEVNYTFLADGVILK